MVDFHHFTFLCAYHRNGVIAVSKVLAWLTRHLLNPLFAVHRLGIHGHKRSHAVATVNIQCLRNGAEAVCSVHIATEFLVIVEAPA